MKLPTTTLALAMATTVSLAMTTGIACAQTPTPTTATQDKTERNAARQKDLKSATEGTVKGYGGAAADGSAKAAGNKAQPKVTPDTASKQAAVKAGTAGVGKGYGAAAADSAAIAAKDKSARAPLPKPKADAPEMRKLVP